MKNTNQSSILRKLYTDLIRPVPYAITWGDKRQLQNRSSSDDSKMFSYYQTKVQPLMNMSKFLGGFIALGTGYTLSLVVFLLEELIVTREPQFDKYTI